MMEASDYLDDDALDDGFFRFDNEHEEAAAMDHLNDMEPMTPPYGVAGPSATAAAAQTGAASGRLHLSSAQVWQAPEQSSPPALSYSPSPGAPSAFQYRQQIPPQRQEHAGHERKRYPSPPFRAQQSHQLSRESLEQAAAHHANHMTSRISELDLRRQYQDPPQRDEERSHHRSRRQKKGMRHEHHDYDQPLGAHPNRRRSSYDDGDESPQDLQPDLRDGCRDSRLTRPRAMDQADDDRNHSRPSYDTSLQATQSLASAHGLEEPELVAPSAEEKDYVVIPEEEVLEMEYNGDEESRVTAEKLRAQVVQAAIHNGKVVLMVTKATGQWWTSSEMRQRRRAAARMVYNAAGQVLSGAGHVIMTSTPLGGFCNSVSTNVTRFKAAPFSYAMTGLGLRKSDDATPHEQQPEPKPIVADEDAFIDDFEDGDGFLDMQDMFTEE
ncbi:hypothetical protein M406DRAFT_74795 [Cryphonectria parasitica EP155]|uniref:Uncharacterized protein n=1 Tax=Cryphonectria parasitica (strain ATCC 38755 / EP155) TaxID=660469 RepID=A0A9P4XVV4_CRYP1|nr:uncharacterized protein M406DRAFT_74795 [Cryphonectria parasitica EP155]KAF3761866.1 hypothetical protein M406DRAFT_74795 [Cryphonectria parasitica EP155]